MERTKSDLDQLPKLHRLIKTGPNAGRWTPFEYMVEITLIAKTVMPGKKLEDLHVLVFIEQCQILNSGGRVFGV